MTKSVKNIKKVILHGIHFFFVKWQKSGYNFAMKKPSKINALVSVLLVLFIIVGGYLLTHKTRDNKILPSENAVEAGTKSDWVEENTHDISDSVIFSRNVKLYDGGLENQRISISSYSTELSPEEWVATQIDLDDVLTITHEWGFYNDHRHLRIESRTVNDDAQIDYFFKDNVVISFVFQPLHALKEPDTNDHYLKTIDEYLRIY